VVVEEEDATPVEQVMMVEELDYEEQEVMVQQDHRILLVDLDQLIMVVVPSVMVAVVVKDHLLVLVGILQMVMMGVLVP
jgi:hypothetical protein